VGGDLNRLVYRLVVEGQDDEQIDVRVGPRDAVGVRAEEDHAVGMGLLDDAVAESLNRGLIGHGRLPPAGDSVA
jgi:hypothetical protein